MTVVINSPEVVRIVERLKCFLKWNADRFDNLDEVHVAVDNPIGWRRGGEYWIKPAIWKSDLCGDDADPQHAARLLRELELLRVQDDENIQVVAKVRDKATRVYAVDGAALAEFRAVTDRRYGGYGRAGALLAIDTQSPQMALITTPSPPDDPPNLAAKLETAASQALDEALAILQLQPHRDDRVYSAVLRAKTAVIGSVLSTQVRVDEAMLRAKRENLLEEHLKDTHACALATLGRYREMTREDIERVLGGAYSRIEKPPPSGVIEQLERMRAGEKPPTKPLHANGPTFDGDAPFEA